MAQTVLWVVFIVGVTLLFALDLGVLNRKAHEISFRQAAFYSALWIGLAAAFGGVVLWERGKEAGMEFFTGYVIELSLSVDNVFLFAVVFSSFQVPAKYQHRVLVWGVLSAIVLRGIMIVAGAALIDRFHWLVYVFGGFLILTGVKMLMQRKKQMDVARNGLFVWLRQRLRVTDGIEGQAFFTRRNGLLYATPLFLVLVLVEITDVLFAMDSIPAIFAVTRDPFIVFTSNILAILGLRSLYFLLAGSIDRFRYLPIGLSFVLVFVGVKMLRAIPIGTGLSLIVIGAILGVSIAASQWTARGQGKRNEAGLPAVPDPK